MDTHGVLKIFKRLATTNKGLIKSTHCDTLLHPQLHTVRTSSLFTILKCLT